MQVIEEAAEGLNFITDENFYDIAKKYSLVIYNYDFYSICQTLVFNSLGYQIGIQLDKDRGAMLTKQRFQMVTKKVNGKTVTVKKVLIPFHVYSLTYNDGTHENVSIRLYPEGAEKYYLNNSFSYWDAFTSSEKTRKVIKIKEVQND